jgi:hypothetical protein
MSQSTRKVLCKALACERVANSEGNPRGPQWVEVPEDFTGDRAYCSVECLLYGEAKGDDGKTN